MIKIDLENLSKTPAPKVNKNSANNTIKLNYIRKPTKPQQVFGTKISKFKTTTCEVVTPDLVEPEKSESNINTETTTEFPLSGENNIKSQLKSDDGIDDISSVSSVSLNFSDDEEKKSNDENTKLNNKIISETNSSDDSDEELEVIKPITLSKVRPIVQNNKIDILKASLDSTGIL